MSHVEDEIRARFVCSKCGHSECWTKELAMTGTGLSKMFDIQNNYYLFVSCTHCGYTEIYHSDVLKGQRSELSNILDLLFG
ncbi:zinc ribbon domain-containing protein [Caenibacillus caldisaponilyticus]|uniref:zinc ribbon domain-containing protein n=1 Tax=Caenibacillus caldisaponilyticus TaxID=1674942 RepID=UPI003F7748C4